MPVPPHTALFFDRDGVINTRLIGEYVRTKEEFVFRPEFLDLFAWSLSLPFQRIVITNQQGVGKGLMSEHDLERVHTYMQEELLSRFGKAFDAIYYCADLADSGSSRRKPEPGMLLEAAREHSLDLVASCMIGDSESDVIAGRRAGTRTILVGSHAVSEWADYTVANLTEAQAVLRKLYE